MEHKEIFCEKMHENICTGEPEGNIIIHLLNNSGLVTVMSDVELVAHYTPE